MQEILQAILWLVIIGVLYFIVNWGIARMGLPDIIDRALNWILVALVVAVVLNVILGLVGHPLFSLPRLLLPF